MDEHSTVSFCRNLRTQAYDVRRTRYLARLGWRELRFQNDVVLANVDRVLEEIWQALDSKT